MVGDSLVAYPNAGAAVAACVVHGEIAQDGGGALRATLWRPGDGVRGQDGCGLVWRLTADGPGGSNATYQRAWIRCQVSARFDRGSDSDSADILGSFYAETIFCWRHARLLVAVDTANTY
jgi:hypothetical protein